MLRRLQNSVSNPVEVISYLALVLVAFALLALKWWQVPPTQDEVTSFFNHVVGDWSRVFDLHSTNNHVLNTLLGKVSTFFLGSNMAAFRLPNVLSFFLLSWYTWRVALLMPILARWSWAIGMLTCYPLFEYFGLARGYGLSFAFLTAHLYYLLLLQKHWSWRSFGLAVLTIALSLLSNIALLNQALISLLVLIALMPKQGRSDRLISVLSLVPLLLVVVLAVSIGLRHQAMLLEYFPNSGGFYEVTVASVLNMLRYPSDHWFILAVLIAAGSVPLAGLFFIRSRAQLLASPVALVAIILWGNIAATMALAQWLDAPLPANRTALYFLPLLFLGASSANIHMDAAPRGLRWISASVALVMAAAVFVGFIRQYDAERSGVEPYAHLPQSVFRFINERSAHAGNNQGTVLVWGDERLQHAWRYYNFAAGNPLNPLLYEGPSTSADFVLYTNEQGEASIYPGVRGTHLGAATDTVLSVKPGITTQEEYIGLLYARSFTSPHNRLTFEGTLTTEACARMNLILEVKNNATGVSHFYQEPLDQLLVDTSFAIHRTWVLPEDQDLKLSLFVHNLDRVALRTQPEQARAWGWE